MLLDGEKIWKLYYRKFHKMMEKKMNLETILSVLEKYNVSETILELAKWISEKGFFAFIEKVEPVTYCGKEGLLYWDYLVWNELTFVDLDTKGQIPLFTSFDDKATEKRFEEIVKEYGKKLRA